MSVLHSQLLLSWLKKRYWPKWMFDLCSKFNFKFVFKIILNIMYIMQNCVL